MPRAISPLPSRPARPATKHGRYKAVDIFAISDRDELRGVRAVDCEKLTDYLNQMASGVRDGNNGWERPPYELVQTANGGSVLIFRNSLP